MASPEPSPQPTTTPDPVVDLATTVYSHLRAIAQHQLQNERPGHTLSATALVHEAFLRLSPSDSAAFYRAAGEAMRKILIDHARRRGAAKRGGNRRRDLDIQTVLDLSRDDRLDECMALDEAFVRLEEENAEAAGVVRLRFYAGLTGEQAAQALGISARQADRAWAFARAFLLRELKAGSADA